MRTIARWVGIAFGLAVLTAGCGTTTKTVTVKVPGPTRTVYIKVPGPVRTVKVPGPTKYVYVDVPGPTKYVDVPGPVQTVTVTAPTTAPPTLTYPTCGPLVSIDVPCVMPG